MSPAFFRTPAEFRRWLRANHASSTELLVGFYKVDSGRPSITWPQSVDGALCYGWIDGIRKRVDDERYTIRFTPRRATSTWSAINLARVQVLTAAGRMRPPGVLAFQRRRVDRSRIYAYEQRGTELADPYAAMLRKNRRAWTFFHAQPPSYRKVTVWWVTSAKREETRLGRARKLVAHSARGVRL